MSLLESVVNLGSLYMLIEVAVETANILFLLSHHCSAGSSALHIDPSIPSNIGGQNIKKHITLNTSTCLSSFLATC